MKISYLEEQALKGNLRIDKRLYRERERFAKFPSKEIVKYRVFSYEARVKQIDGSYDEGSFFKIRRADYKKLLSLILDDAQRTDFD